MSESDETFLQRWSRRKIAERHGTSVMPPHAVQAGVTVDAVPDEDAVASLDTGDGPDLRAADKVAVKGQSDVAPTPARKPLTEEDFADVDFSTLDYSSDYGRFMETGVPESIRQKALTRLWHSDTMFTQVDPFQDYAGDYTDAAVAVPGGLIKTAYKVGQGFLSDDEAAAWDKLGKQKPEDAAMRVHAGDIVIACENPDQPEVHAFLAASDAYLSALYPAESNHFVDITALQQASVQFFVARSGATAVGCGAIVLAGDGSAEIKRMWIDPKARGQRLGQTMLASLEAAARASGCSMLRLETGISQPEALSLYRKAGYAEIPAFGTYQPDPLSVFMAKRLIAGS